MAVTRLNLLEESGMYRREPYPCGMTELFGLEIAENRELLNSQTDANMGVFDISSLPKSSTQLRCFGGTAGAERYVEEVLPRTCTVLEKLSSTCFAGSPLLTRNSYGKGMAFYVSAFLDVTGVRKMVRRVLEECGISLPDAELPPEVSRIERGEYRFYMNSSSRKVSLTEKISGKILLGNAEIRMGDSMTLNPYDVLIVRASGTSE